MSEKTINDLTLQFASTDVAANDLSPVWDTSGATTGKIPVSALIQAILAQSAGALSASATQGLIQAEPATTGSPSASLAITRPAHTALTASTAYHDVTVSAATQQFATGALTLQQAIQLLAPTYAFVGASTITTAANLSVAKPVAGTNATITRSYAIDAEDSRIQGTLTVMQSGGTPGTTEVTISNDGTNTTIANASSGSLYLQSVFGPVSRIEIDKFGNISIGSSTAFQLSVSGGNFRLNDGYSINLGPSGNNQIKLARVGSNVDVLTLTGYSPAGSPVGGWLQQTAGDAPYVATDVTNATNTMAAVTGMATSVLAGRKYGFEATVKCNNSSAAEGIALDFDASTATMTAFRANGYVTNGVTNVATNQVSSALATDFTWTTITGETWIKITGSFVVNAAGTFAMRFAEGTAHTVGTATVSAGSLMRLWDIP